MPPYIIINIRTTLTNVVGRPGALVGHINEDSLK